MVSGVFIAVPLISFICSFFLFLVVLSAKKTRQLASFIALLACFVLWTLGSLLMRLGVYPSASFWCDVSIFGVFCVPFCVYYFLFYYTNSRSFVLLHALLGLWAAVIVMNFFGLFITNAQVSTVTGAESFNYGITPLAIIPVVLAAATIIAAIRLAFVSVRHDGVPIGTFTPLIIGIMIMFVGLVASVFVNALGAISDTIYCLINAICIYYALYKKRLITLTPIASNVPTYFMAVVFATIVGTVSYPSLNKLFIETFELDDIGMVLLMTLCFSLLTIISYCLIHWFVSNLFIKGQELRDKELTKLSHHMGKSLELSDAVDAFRAFLSDNVECGGFNLCMPDDTGDKFVIVPGAGEMYAAEFAISRENPLILWLQENNQSIRYADFCKTKGFKSMWASEKRALKELEVELALPINCDSELSCVVFFSAKNKNRSFTSSEVSFLESAAAIASISFKNASLYLKIQNEARRDAITGLYNRNYFLLHVSADFDKSKHDKFTLAIISLDDFRLFNELYGSPEGDNALRLLANVITAIMGDRGMVSRYSGKEFVVSLPFCSISTAENLVEEVRATFNQSLNPTNSVYKKFLTFSAGICGYPVSASSVDETINYANLALYSAKKNGKNRTFVYSYNHADEETQHEQEAENKFQLAENSISTILALTAAIDAKDHYTFNHSDNVSKYASVLAKAIGLDSEHVEIIRQAGLLHDIGKIGIPEAILAKTGPLTDEEYEIMKQHVEGSIAMIRHLPSLDYVIPVAIGHHERWDGRGYPRGIRGENIPIGARCLCLADSFDAMTTKRSYRNAMPVEVAVQEIERNLGTQFDPDLGKTFVELVKSGRITVDPPRQS